MCLNIAVFAHRSEISVSMVAEKHFLRLSFSQRDYKESLTEDREANFSANQKLTCHRETPELSAWVIESDSNYYRGPMPTLETEIYKYRISTATKPPINTIFLAKSLVWEKRLSKLHFLNQSFFM